MRPGARRERSDPNGDPVTDLIDTTEMYLKTIFELEEEGIPPLRARIAERLGHSGPTVSQTIARMDRDGLVHVATDRQLELSTHGRALAMRVVRKHRIAERLLVDVIGLEWELVHEEACRWEHVMSDHVEEKILSLLKGIDESPYGLPIPGLDELADPSGPRESGTAEPFRTGLCSLVELLADLPVAGTDDQDGMVVVVRRIGEPVQTDAETLALLTGAGVLPARRVRLRRTEGRVVVVGEGVDPAQAVSLPDDVAMHVFAMPPKARA